MSGSWTVDIPNCTLTFSYVASGYVKCVVSSNTPPFQRRVFAFCMRCKDLGCVAWFYSHQDAQRFRSTGEMEEEFHARRQHFFEDIKSDVADLGSPVLEQAVVTIVLCNHFINSTNPLQDTPAMQTTNALAGPTVEFIANSRPRSPSHSN